MLRELQRGKKKVNTIADFFAVPKEERKGRLTPESEPESGPRTESSATLACRDMFRAFLRAGFLSAAWRNCCHLRAGAGALY